MKILFPLLLGVAMLSACANGPTHDYYNPAIIGAHYKGPVTIEQVKGIQNVLEQRQSEGYAIIGKTIYSGKYPETIELIAQAKRVGANHVVYESHFIQAQPGSWHFGFGNWGGGGGSDNGMSDNVIVFMGK